MTPSMIVFAVTVEYLIQEFKLSVEYFLGSGGEDQLFNRDFLLGGLLLLNLFWEYFFPHPALKYASSMMPYLVVFLHGYTNIIEPI